MTPRLATSPTSGSWIAAPPHVYDPHPGGSCDGIDGPARLASAAEGSMTDRQLLKRARQLVEDRETGILDLLGIRPRRPHDVLSALAAVAPNFESYCRLNDLVMASAQELFGADSVAHMISHDRDQAVLHLFDRAIARCSAR